VNALSDRDRCEPDAHHCVICMSGFHLQKGDLRNPSDSESFLLNYGCRSLNVSGLSFPLSDCKNQSERESSPPNDGDYIHLSGCVLTFINRRAFPGSEV